MAGRPPILMCPPDFYGIEYEINPWMSRLRQADHRLATRQWHDLRNVLEEAGAEILLLDPAEGLPDMVFTANTGLVFEDRVILARFRYPQRQGETPLAAARFRQMGLTVLDPPEGKYFEGAGDALFCGDTLLAGYRIRSDAVGLQQIGGQLGCRVIPLELVDPYFYHLDTCFCPLEPGVALYHADAFDEYGRSALAHSVERLLLVDADEARRFACNAVVVGRRVITNTGCPRLHAMLDDEGYEPIETPLDEFVKAGGSAKCLTLRLDGEEAAGWKYAGGK